MTAALTQEDIKNWEADRKADREWEKWRRRAAQRLPTLAARVFALGNKPYMGCGLHYALVSRLGRMITEVGDPTRSALERKERYANRLITQVVFEALHTELLEAENSARTMAGATPGISHAS